MTLSEMLVFLIMQLKWRNVILVDGDPEVSAVLLNSLNERSVSVASVGASMVETYLWPEKFSLSPQFDGYVMVVDLSRTEEMFRQLLRFLKEKYMFGPHFRWIIGANGCLHTDSILNLFDEGDRILIVTSDTMESVTCRIQTFHKEFKVWGLHSIGNGSIDFRQKFLDKMNGSSYLEEPLFEEPFTDFGGRILKISSLGSPPIQIRPEKGEWRWSGYIFKIVNTLSEIYNFSYTVKEADNRLYGTLLEDGTWPGMIGELVNKSVDMGVGDLSWTLDRSTAADLTSPVFPETVTFIYRAPGFYSRTWILFQDIDFRVWISLTFAMILGCTVYCLTLYVSEAHIYGTTCGKTPEEMFIDSAVRSTGAIYRALLGQGIVYHPKAISCRTVLGTWFLGTLILTALYGGSLTSTLSLHRSPRPVDNLRDLLKRYPNAMIAVKDNSQIHSYFKKSEVWHHVWLTNIQKNVIPGKLHIEDTMIEVHKKRPERSPIYVWVAERSMLVKQMHKYTEDPSVCDLYVAKEDIVRSDWSLALIRNSPFLLQFNEKIHRMQRLGLLQKWQFESWNADRGACRPTDGRNPTGKTVISITDTQACFFILSIGWIAGFIVLLAERRVDYHHRKQIVKQNEIFKQRSKNFKKRKGRKRINMTTADREIPLSIISGPMH